MRIRNKIKKLALTPYAIAKRKIEKAKRKRNESKTANKVGFEYKDRKKEW